MIIRTLKSFAFSSCISTICLLFIELFIRLISGFDFSPITQEYLALFPSATMAAEVNALLYGCIGISFSVMSFIFEKNRIGFVLQNVIYCIGTGMVWIPIVTFLWQLWRYPAALYCTILGFFITYIIITVINYRITKKEIEQINHAVSQC